MDIIKDAKIMRDEIQSMHLRGEKCIQNFSRERQRLQCRWKNDMKMKLKDHLGVVQHTGQTGELTANTVI
jgi:t-SNARE complex subunit (syntaxin)